MRGRPMVSLCIPTNGILELVSQVLDSIYSQGIDDSLFEVVVGDNGNNSSFFYYMNNMMPLHRNLIYFKSDKKNFMNETETYNRASGVLIKFVNHRTKLMPNTLQYFIDFAKTNYKRKPFIYFSNGVLNSGLDSNKFDLFVRHLGLYNTWSTGIAFWKDIFGFIPLEKTDELFPHTYVLFGNPTNDRFIIDNTILLDEIHINHKNKGQYDVFYAFSVRFLDILKKLKSNRDITACTYKIVKTQLLKFCVGMYFSFVIDKEPCSYIIKNVWLSVSKHFGFFKFYSIIAKLILKRYFNKIVNSRAIKK